MRLLQLCALLQELQAIRLPANALWLPYSPLARRVQQIGFLEKFKSGTTYYVTERSLPYKVILKLAKD